ncbi:MAG: 3-deoxy-7-phosphoheptulonate synthase [Lachnospiraceae bacterium]|nr:3-deoxy-7-phosphoheptulonate synthase [Lachnospiraceae bacterium]
MIIVMKPAAPQASIQHVVSMVREAGLETHLSEGKEVTIIGVVGDKSRLQDTNLELAPDVEKIVPITESYKLSNKKFHPDPSTIQVGNTEIGPNTLTIMAGPCAIESEKQLLSIAHAVKAAGANFLRGGAYKPRTSPYSFQGLEEEGLLYMKHAKEETGLSTICEVISRESLACAIKYVDMIQIGARNMQNFQLLREVGKAGVPVMLKRGLSATIEEWLNAAEYIISEGNPHVVLCERGIRTYETSTRNTLDISAVPVLKSKTHLPVIVDPSHASGVWEYVAPLSRCAVAVGADGLMIEVHNNPECALSDGAQSLTFAHFSQLTQELKAYAQLAGRNF